jgi:hypothetical protein
MEKVTNGEGSAAVSDGSGRGAAIGRRLSDLSIGDREFQRETGIDRKTLRRAIGNDPSVRESSYAAIETNLDRLERRAKGSGPAQEGGQGQMTLRLSLSSGVEAVVEGSVEDMDALIEALERIARRMREEPEHRGDSATS